MVDKIIFVYLVFCCSAAPAVVSSILPLTFNNRVPGAAVACILVLYAFLSKLKPDLGGNEGKINWVFILLIAVKLYAFYIFYLLVYVDVNVEFFRIQQVTLISVLFCYFSFFIFSYVVKFNRTSVPTYVWGIATGTLGMAIFALLTLYEVGPKSGIFGLYEIKRNLYVVQQNDLFTKQWLRSWNSAVEYSIGFGPLLALLGTFLLSYAILESRRLLKYVAYFAYLVAFLSVSRSAVLGVCLGLLAAIGTSSYLSVRNNSKKTGFRSFILFVLFVLFVTVVVYSDYSARFSLAAVRDQPRWDLWWNGILFVIKNPMGGGQDILSFISEYHSGDMLEGLFFSHNHVHNTFIQMGVEGGFLGFIVIAFLYYLSFKQSFINMKRYRMFANNGYSVYGSSLAGALFASHVTALAGMMFTSSFLSRASVYTGVIIFFMVLVQKQSLYINWQLSRIR